jgi:hypothetical protein
MYGLLWESQYRVFALHTPRERISSFLLLYTFFVRLFYLYRYCVCFVHFIFRDALFYILVWKQTVRMLLCMILYECDITLVLGFNAFFPIQYLTILGAVEAGLRKLSTWESRLNLAGTLRVKNNNVWRRKLWFIEALTIATSHNVWILIWGVCRHMIKEVLVKELELIDWLCFLSFDEFFVFGNVWNVLGFNLMLLGFETKNQ